MPSQFNEAAWVARFGAALEAVAADARPSYSPHPADVPRGRVQAKITGWLFDADTTPSRRGRNTIRPQRASSNSRTYGSTRIRPKRATYCGSIL